MGARSPLTDCDGQATTPINKPYSDLILLTSKTPHIIISSTMAKESMQSTMFYSFCFPLVSLPEICCLLWNCYVPVQDDDTRYQHSV